MFDALRRERDTREAERSLAGFIKHGWGVLEPGAEYHDGWHIHAIAEHLEACLAREIRQLIINIPPRHSKSLLAACFFPVFTWIADPEERFLFASYAASLSVRDSLKCRRLIQSVWFQERWGSRFKLIGDQNSKMFYENDKTGYRMATSVGASTTGHGGDIIVVDDPLNALEATSETVLENTQTWWSQAMSTRLNNPKTGIKIVVMQRLHDQDTTGQCLAEGGWEHLMLPAEFETKRRCVTSLGWVDPRKDEGELLWPEHFGSTEVAALKLKLGTYGTAGQLQQRPAPEGGGILKEEFFQMWPASRELPEFMFVLQSWDTAYSEDKTLNDPSAMTAYGVFAYKGRNCVMLLDVVNEPLEYPKLKERVVDEWGATYGDNRVKANTILMEKKASGQSIIQDMRVAGIPVVPYNPGKASKKQRTHAVAPIHETYVVYIPESKKVAGKFVSWAIPFVTQVTTFPTAPHDDMHDTYTQALTYLHISGWIVAPGVEEEKEEDDTAEVYSGRKNPYAS
jgi:predicted phage terminase large subunit-like protein